jgi:hypothetical protein
MIRTEASAFLPREIDFLFLQPRETRQHDGGVLRYPDELLGEWAIPGRRRNFAVMSYWPKWASGWRRSQNREV